MDLKLKTIIKNYLQRILDISLNGQKYSTVIFNASFCLDPIKNIIEELKFEYHINNVIFNDFDNDKIKTFFQSNPTVKEIEQFIPKFLEPFGRTKIIYFKNEITDLSNNYLSDYSKKYYDFLFQYNPELFNTMQTISAKDECVTVCPNKEWAKCLLGSQNQIEQLWMKISEIQLNDKDTKNEIEERIKRKEKLNEMKIYNLYFYTNLGTNFKISLNPHSIWITNPNSTKNLSNFFNYPSYEIFTSPNCYSAEGKIVLSKKRLFYHDIEIENAVFEFSKGRLIDCHSNSKDFDSIVLNASNKMNRIGEIALVSQFSPLSKLNDIYCSILLDENTGCHFALGDYITDCVGIDSKKLKEKGARYYRYNTSAYHTDFVFGNDSISVEAETKRKEKILLMKNGRWTI